MSSNPARNWALARIGSLAVAAVVAALWLGWFATTVGAAPQQNDTSPQPVRWEVTEGRWKVMRLAGLGDRAPGTEGNFQAFGEAAVVGRSLVFWGKFGNSGKHWGLFSVKDGKLEPLLLPFKEFTEPDSVKKEMMHPDDVRPAGLSSATGTMLYMTCYRLLFGKGRECDLYTGPTTRTYVYSGLKNATVYGWDATQWRRILGGGDEMTHRGARFILKKVTVRSLASDGRILLEYETEKPTHEFGLAVLDASGIKPLWHIGDALPGQPQVQIDGWGDVLLSGDTILAVLLLKGAPYKHGVFRVHGDRADKVLAERDPVPGEPAALVKEVLWLAAEEGDKVAVYAKASTPKWGEVLVIYHRGQPRSISSVPLPPAFGLDPRKANLRVKQVLLSSAKSSQLLFTVTSPKKKSTAPWSRKNNHDWEALYVLHCSVGAPSAATAREEVCRLGAFEGLEAPIVLRRAPGQAKGAIVETSAAGGLKTAAYWDTSSPELQPPPTIPTEGVRVTLANVVGWAAPDLAYAILDDGIYVLRK